MRIWVTGIGVVSPLARGARATMDGLLAGDRAFADLTLFEIPKAKTRIAAEVKAFAKTEAADPSEAALWSRTDAMALLAAREALAEAKLDPRADRMALAVGGSTTGMFESELELGEMSREGAKIEPMASVISHPLSSTADHLTKSLGSFDRIRSICSACSSGANAILVGANWITAGLATRVLAGGSDGLCRLTYAGFGALGALASEPCRPFDRRRNGLNLGEGAAFLVLENDASARARGARPIAELVGWAVGAEAHHITNPDPSGVTAARIMSAALARGGVSARELDYVNAHGTATQLNDAMEAAAIRACLGAETTRVAVSSSKGQIGHTLAAAGAIEAAVTAMAIARGEIPPTVGLEEVDPECALEHVFSRRRMPIRAAISNSFGFGGTDTALVFAEPERFAEHAARSKAVVITGAASIGPLGVIGADATAAYLEPGPSSASPLAIPFAEHLDLARARRIDRAGRFMTILAERALSDASLAPASFDANGLGAIIATAFASVAGSTAFIRRLVDKGATMVSPADFPNLVPSSPVGHASIYLGLRGVVFTTSDLGASAESAFATAFELCAAGEADAIVAGSFEESTPLVEGCIAPVTSGPHGPRGEGGAVVVVEALDRARARGRRPLARIAWMTSWRGEADAPLALAPSPQGRSLVAYAHDCKRVDDALAGSAWAAAPRTALSPRTGDHEGAGGFAIAGAAAAIGSGRIDSALLIGEAPNRTIAIVLVADVGEP